MNSYLISKEALERENNFNFFMTEVPISVLRSTRIHSANCDEHENIFSKVLYWKGWDAKLFDSKVTGWEKLVEVLKMEEVVKVGQKYSYKADDGDEIVGAELHGFSDASSLVYEANICFLLFINLVLLRLIWYALSHV